MKTLPTFWFEPRPWIDGQWDPGGEVVTVRNPATAEKIAEVPRADAATVAPAIEGAVKAQREWREVSAVERGLVLKRTAALLLARKDEFARLLTAEQGKPYAQAAGEVEYAASFFQWFGEEARRVYGRIAAHPEAGREFLHRAQTCGCGRTHHALEFSPGAGCEESRRRARCGMQRRVEASGTHAAHRARHGPAHA